MSGLIVPQFPSGITIEELSDLVAKLAKEVDWFANGNISDQNISIIAGYRASATELKHKSGLVGLSGFDASNPLATRIWAGNADKSIAPFRVQQNGYMYSTRGFIGGWDIDATKLSGTGTIQGGTIIGSEIKTSASTYPRIELSSIGNLLAAYQTAGDVIKLVPVYSSGPPAILFDIAAATQAKISLLTGLLSITSSGTTDISIQSAKDLYLTAVGLVKFESWSKIYNTGNLQTLQQALNAITSSIAPGSYAVVTYSGGVAASGRALIASDIPIIAQSQVMNLTTDLAAKAPIASPTFTGTATLPTTTSIGSVSGTEIGYLDGVTSAIQTQLDSKKRIEYGTVTSGAEGLAAGVYYAIATITYPAFSSRPNVTAVNTAIHTAWIGAILPVGFGLTQSTIYISSMLTGQVAGRTIDWVAIGPP